MRKQILDVLTDHGTLIQPDAAEYLLAQSDPIGTINALLDVMQEYPLVLTMEEVRRGIELAARAGRGGRREPIEVLEVEPKDAQPREAPAARAFNMQVIMDVTGSSTCEGSISDFSNYFNDRYDRLKKILRQRRELVRTQSTTDINGYEGDVQLIGIVQDCKTTKNGHKIVEIDDKVGSAAVLIPQGSELIGEEFVKDEVIGVVGKSSKRNDLVLAKRIIRPDIPHSRETNRAKEHVFVAFASDIHVGSDTFLEGHWRRFISWLKGNGQLDPISERIRYLVIPGDCVDGIGVYPGQEEELVIKDVYKQYEALAELMKDIPDRIKVVMLPGNHDAVRPAEPQPTFQKEIIDLFDSNVAFLGNPCYFSVEGVEILAYHGKSMDDFVTGMRAMTYNDPIAIMKEMLKRRHLAPIYGERTPISPEKRDYMVIDRIPDIFVTGHVHSTGIDRYNRVILVNASTWQGQTQFQKKHNFIPDPAKVPVIDLKSGRAKVVDFGS